MNRKPYRILTNSGQGAFAILYDARGQQREEQYLSDGYLVALTRPSTGEGTVRSKQRLNGATPVLAHDGLTLDGDLWLLDVFEGDGRDQCRVVPAADARQCECGAWVATTDGQELGIHVEGCASLAAAH